MQHELNDLDLCPLHQVYEKMELDFALIAARLALLASLEREECRGCYQRAVIHLVEKVPEEQPEEPTEESGEADAPETAADDETAQAEPTQDTPDESNDEETEPAPAPDEETAVVCEQPKEPEYEEQIELIEKEVKPYRVTMKLNNMILMPSKEAWNKEA